VHFTRNFNVLTTIFYRLSITIEIIHPDQIFLAAQLNNLEGRFLQPLNRSVSFPTGNQIKFSGGNHIVYKPEFLDYLEISIHCDDDITFALAKPACKACDLPKFFMKRTPFTLGFS
jgi:hypothetical protein